MASGDVEEPCRERQAAEQGSGVVVEGIEGTLTQPVRLNVFVNKPDANRTTSLEDPHFLGYIDLLPTHGRVESGGRLFDLSTVKAIDPAAPLEVTLVPVVGRNMAPSDASLRLSRIYARREN
jgi:hypothetical protein